MRHEMGIFGPKNQILKFQLFFLAFFLFKQNTPNFLECFSKHQREFSKIKLKTEKLEKPILHPFVEEPQF